ncbi:AlbA family DNA-binding domain-containing protein [Chelativorans sp. YIM 93263]|uniref:AlbA family DNA-binding domain-containing protein n=1 Tax=Chelativorans sp. YIM 93263 TaxID=2906648 RepID=UPI002378703C|nr:ATP-binding protein [Chelativorans sp. YIM 93263]
MSIFKPILQEVAEADIQQLLADEQHEGLGVEFKRDMYGNADADKKEFLKDLSAFANSAGGQLLIGVDELQGAANAISPIVGDPDVTLQRLEQMARTGLEPRIVGLQTRAVPIGGGGFVYILRVPRSWNPPHRVSFQNTNRFYLRSSAGAHEASVEELRAAFANGADMRERMTAYVAGRVQKIADNEGVVRLAVGDGTEGRLVLHILPFAAFAGGTQVDVAAAMEVANLLQPFGATGNSRINFDGFMVVRPADIPHGYTQVFRNGVVEATKVRVVADHPQLGMRIPMRSFVEPIYQRLPQYVRALQALNVPPPFGVSITVAGVEGSHLGINNNPLGLDFQHPIDRPTLVLPMQVIADFGTDASYRAAIAPAIDALFNAVGVASAADFLANFNEAGVWIGQN